MTGGAKKRRHSEDLKSSTSMVDQRGVGWERITVGSEKGGKELNIVFG